MMHLTSNAEPRGQALALSQPPFEPGTIDRTAEVQDIWGILWRGRNWIAGCSALLVAAALVYCAVTPSLYTATSQILIDPRDRQVMTNDINPAAVAPDGGVTQVESQARVIESASVLGRAITAAGLTRDPEFADVGEMTKVLDVARGLVGLARPPETPADIEGRTLRNLRKRLAIKRADKVFVIDVIVTAKEPAKASRIANAIAEAYLADQAAARTEGSRRTSDALAGRLDEQRERVRQAERQVEDYKASNDLIRSNGRLVTEQQLGEVNLQLSAAQARTAELKARIDQIDQARRRGLDLESTAEALQSTVVAKLRAQYSELVERQADLRSQLGARHPSIVSANTQIEEVRRLISAELGRIERSTRADYERALAGERAIGANLDRLRGESATTSQASVRLRELERELEASRAVYTAFLVRTREIREQAGIDTANARIITHATPPQEKSWPLPGLFVFGALVTGLGIGSGIALLREYAAPTVQSGRQLRALADAPVLGEIADRPARTRAGSEAESGEAAGLILARVLGYRDSAAAGSKTIFLTSGGRDAQARRRAARLLGAAAEARGLRVLVVEAEKLGGTVAPGLLDVLRGDQRLDAVTRAQPPSKIRLLGIGRPHQDEFGDERDVRVRFRAEVGRRFDLVILDGGTLTEDHRAVGLIALADAVLLVARTGITPQADVLDTAEAAALAGRPVSAAILVAGSAAA